MINLYPTPHAFRRARERVGWSRRTLERMLERIFHDGLFAKVCAPGLRSYLQAVGLATGGRRACVYGEHVWIFARNLSSDTCALITVLPLPLELRPLAHKARARHLPAAA